MKDRIICESLDAPWVWAGGTWASSPAARLHGSAAGARGRRPPCALPCLASLGTHDARRAVSPVSGRLFQPWPGSVRRPWCAALAGRGRLRTQEEPCALQSAAGASRERPHAAVRAHPDPTCPTRRAPEETATATRPCATGLTHDGACLPDATCGARLRSSYWIPQRRSPSMNPFDLRLPRFRDVSDQEPLGMDLPPSILAA